MIQQFFDNCGQYAQRSLHIRKQDYTAFHGITCSTCLCFLLHFLLGGGGLQKDLSSLSQAGTGDTGIVPF